MKLKELEKRLKSEPDNLGLRVQVAGLMRESGRSIEAVELYRSVALAYRDQGRTQQAIAVCRSILEIAPDDAACQGLIAMLQGRGTPSRPPPTAIEPPPPIAAPVRAPTAGTAPDAPPAPARPASAITPVHITEPIDVPSVPHLRPPTKPHPAQPETSADATLPSPDTPGRPSTPSTGIAPRRSSLDETPLPRPVPYHVHDPTSQPHKISARDLEKTSSSPNVTSRTGGLAEAARRISGLITAKDSIPGIPNKEMDLAAELDTRQRPKIKSEELKKLAPPPPDPDETAPRAIADRFHDVQTYNPALDDDLATDRHDVLTPPPRGSDDAITPPPLLGVVPPDVIQPPRSTALPTRPPKRVSIPPVGPSKTSSQPPLGTEPRSRDSDDELTVPRDKPSFDDDDDE